MSDKTSGLRKPSHPRSHRVMEPGSIRARTWYVESSALIAAFLETDDAARETIHGPGRFITSALTLAEANRAVVRAHTAGRINTGEERAVVRGLESFARRCEIVAVSGEILARAGRPFPIEPIRTLDAIHIATIELLGEAPQLVTFVTRDKRVAANVRALGYAVG